jgi:5-hydroxyisourate hydrolase
MSLSTHVLDVSRGEPASGMLVEVHILTTDGRRLLATATTNVQGRTDAPLLAERLEPGIYELTFHAAAYFRGHGLALPEPAFLGDIVIRVGLAEAAGHYHVPLLLSPYGYSTYRGS